MGFKLKASDQRAFNKKIKALSRFPKELDAVLRDNASKAVVKMKQDAPKDTGRLRRRIHYFKKGRALYLESTAFDPRSGKDYAPFQEYGGRYFQAQPYFYKNIRLMLKKLNRDLIRRLRAKR